MADRKITALSELTAPVATDVFPVVDVSEADNANKNKNYNLNNNSFKNTILTFYLNTYKFNKKNL